MIEKQISINITTEEDSPVFVYVERSEDGLRIKFINNFKEAVEFSEKVIAIEKGKELTIKYKVTTPDNYDFVEGV